MKSKKIVGAFLIICLGTAILSTPFVMAHNLSAHLNAPLVREDREILTDVVHIIVSGNVTTIITVEYDTAYTFTSRRVLRRRNDSVQRIPRTVVDNDVLSITAYRGVLVVVERETGRVHVI